MEQIKITTDYNKFSFMDGNRDISKKNMLVKSINEIDLTEYKPIIVDEKYVIIDGQHRFMACKELKKPIYYIILHGVDEKKALIKLNAFQKMWKQDDYLKFFNKNIGERYSELNDFMNKYNICISAAIIIFPKQQINSEILKSGKLGFDINPQCDKIAEFITSEEIRMLNFSQSRQFVLAIRKAFEIYSVNQMGKIKINSIKIPHCAEYSQYLIVFSNILKSRKRFK